MIIKCFNEEVKANKNCKVNGSAVCFTYNIFMCSLSVFFIVEVYNVLIKIYTVCFREKWVNVKRAGCWMVWKNGPADVSGVVQNDHLPGHKLRVLFATGCPPRCADGQCHVWTSPCRNSTMSWIIVMYTCSCITPQMRYSPGFRSRLFAGHMSWPKNSGVSRYQFYQVITWIVRKHLLGLWSKSDVFQVKLAIYCQIVSSFLRSLCTKNYWNLFIFERVIPKIKSDFFGTQCNTVFAAGTADSHRYFYRPTGCFKKVAP